MSRVERKPFKPRKRQERGTRRVADIVAAAAKLFAERGFDGTSMNAIAKAAGLTIGSIYQYFPSREAVVDAVAEAYLAAWRAEKDEALKHVHEVSLHEFMHRGVLSLFEFHRKHAGVKTFLDADPERAKSIRMVQEEVAVFAPLLGRYYPDQPYEELARVVFTVSAIIRGAAAAVPTVDALDKRAAYVDDITLATVQYIRARLGPPAD